METEIIAQMDCVPVLQPAVACDDVVESIGKMPPLPACTVAQLTDAEVEAFNPSGPVDLDELVEGITSVLQSDMSNKMTTEQKRDLLLKWLGALDTSTGDLDRYSHFDLGKKYTRNLIATDNQTFTLMLLCWSPLKESPIHDHPCEGCWMRVVSGSVCETRYTNDGQTLTKTDCTQASAPTVIYIHDSIGLHKVGAADGPAMTLHLYAPPFRTCRIWLDEDGPSSKCLQPSVTYHSEYGTVIDYGGTATACTAAENKPSLCS